MTGASAACVTVVASAVGAVTVLVVPGAEVDSVTGVAVCSAVSGAAET